MTMFSLNAGDVQRMEKDLELFAARAAPYASRQALTATAFRAREYWQAQIRNELVERNQYTRNSVRVDMARSLRIDSQEARVGSVAEYMSTTEEGGTESGSTGAHSIPTGYSAGQEGQRPRTRLPRRRYRMPNITLQGTDTQGRQFASKRQEVFVKVLMAVRDGHRFVFLEGGTTRGIYEVRGRGGSGSRATGIRMKMVQNLAHQSVRISATPTLEPAVELTQGDMEGIYRNALLEQLRRNGVLGW